MNKGLFASLDKLALRKNLPTDLREIFFAVKRVGLHYTLFCNQLPLLMRLSGPKNPKKWLNLRPVAKVALSPLRSHGSRYCSGSKRMRSSIAGGT
jgi:hypothetical protein